MDIKKNPNVDVNKSRGLFLNLGLVATLLATIVLFQWNFADAKLAEMVGQAGEDEEMEEVIVTEVLPPPPPKIEIPQTIEVVEDDEEVEEVEQIFEEPDEDAKIVEVVKQEVAEEVEEEIFLIVEQSAEPVGGMAAFTKHVGAYLAKNYPARAKQAGIQGKVFIKFYVDKDGSTKGFQILKGIGGGCDEVAIEAIKSFGSWSPPKQRGRAVKQWFSLPINFRIG